MLRFPVRHSAPSADRQAADRQAAVRRSLALALSLTALTLLVFPGILRAGDGAAGVGEAGAPPADLGEGWAGALVETGLRIETPAGVGMTLWPVAEAPAEEGGGGYGGMGVAHPSMPEGGLVGVLELGEGWTGFRGQSVPAGRYALRYLLRPEDGYHMGVSYYRDFLVLVPVGDDPGPAERPGYDRVVELSRGAGTSHQPVMALVPVEAGPAEAGETPALVEDAEGHPTLALGLGDLTLGLVLEGEGEV